MDKKIAILRGINVGGRRKILMADLRSLFEDLGFTDVKTYIQSGNVIFNSAPKISAREMEDKIEKSIADKYDFSVPVIVRTAKELAKSVKKNPFYQEKEVDIKQLHLTFLKEKPSKENLAKMASFVDEADQFVIKEKDTFLLCPGKYHQSKFTNNFFEKKLKVTATTRNWKTVLKLLELSHS